MGKSDTPQINKGMRNTLEVLLDLTRKEPDVNTYFGPHIIEMRGKYGLPFEDSRDPPWLKGESPRNINEVRMYLEMAHMLDYLDRTVVKSGVNSSIKGYRVKEKKISEVKKLIRKNKR